MYETLEALNKKRFVGSKFFDFKKAFDSINHGILLAKLQFHWITDRAYNLINTYLENRSKSECK